MTRLLVAAALVLGWLVVPAAPAAACSCGAPAFQPDEDMEWAGIESYDGVFIGTATDRQVIAPDTVVWTFDIDSVVAENTAGDLATPIEVVTPAEGGACGLDTVSVGDQRAVGLRWQDGDWRSDLCSQDDVSAVDGLGDRRQPAGAPPVAGEGGLSTDSGWGLALVGVGFGTVVGAALMAVALSRRRDRV